MNMCVCIYIMFDVTILTLEVVVVVNIFPKTLCVLISWRILLLVLFTCTLCYFHLCSTIMLPLPVCIAAGTVQAFSRKWHRGSLFDSLAGVGRGTQRCAELENVYCKMLRCKSPSEPSCTVQTELSVSWCCKHQGGAYTIQHVNRTDHKSGFQPNRSDRPVRITLLTRQTNIYTN